MERNLFWRRIINPCCT